MINIIAYYVLWVCIKSYHIIIAYSCLGHKITICAYLFFTPLMCNVCHLKRKICVSMFVSCHVSMAVFHYFLCCPLLHGVWEPICISKISFSIHKLGVGMIHWFVSKSYALCCFDTLSQMFHILLLFCIYMCQYVDYENPLIFS